MKVGITLAPFGEKKPSGLGRFVLEHTLALIKAEPTWSFYIFVKGDPDTSIFSDFSNVTVRHLSNSIWWKDIACLRNRTIDVWLYHNPYLPLLCRPKRSVVTALDFGAFYEDQTRSLESRFTKWIQYRSLQRATYVLCTSEATKKDLHRFFPTISEGKVGVAMCGFTRVCQVYQAAPVPDLPKMFYLLVGVIKPRKNQITAVKAFIQAKENGLQGKLLICGKGSGDYFDQLMQVILQSSYHEDIQYLGYRTDEELVTLYQKAWALIFPSHVEGFGMSIVEAMSCGTPVIASSNGAQGEVAEGYALVSDSRDIAGFRDAILKMQNETLREELIKKGKMRADDFSWEKSAIAYSKILNQVKNSCR